MNGYVPFFLCEDKSSSYPQIILQILNITAMKSKLQQPSECLQSWLSQHTVSYHILSFHSHMHKHTYSAAPLTEGKSS